MNGDHDHHAMSKESAEIFARYPISRTRNIAAGYYCQMDLIRRHEPSMTQEDRCRAAYTTMHLERVVSGHNPFWEYRP